MISDVMVALDGLGVGIGGGYDATVAVGLATLPPRARALVGRLCCATCRGPVVERAPGVRCVRCGAEYAVRGSVLDLRPAGRVAVQSDADAWSEHWSGEKQASLVQRFFSWYRKAVFARAVAWFAERYLPARGVLVEAGSGTAETSMLMRPGEGRTLVALDLIPQVLEHCHPVMDVRLAGDLFHLPFATESVDGIWNVGVMEHFTQEQIDAILREFHRVLRPGGRVILFWPGTDSIPQRMLDAVAWVVNRRKRAAPYRFHPPEISRLASVRAGREVLARNGLLTVTIDPGPRTLMAFKTVVGEKPMPARVRPSGPEARVPSSSGEPING
jgi:SAM-dependent methyltransferase